MELDELKKSWNTLDEHLKRKKLTDETQIAKMIATHKADAQKSIGRLSSLQRLSLSIGIVGLTLLLTIWLIPSVFHISAEWQPKINTFVVFLCVSILAGIWWDYRTYRWMMDTRIDEMPIAVVSKRMENFRRWTKYEIIAISIWAILFNVLNYWVMGYYRADWKIQTVLILVFIVFDVAVIYLFYKKVVYKNINNARKNIEELKQICTD
ncbi:hypothetical protein [uncultured Bacteroides sp.]|uniref:hypothetical protein n=1 Tax=uncultured Bacteroides sp. TaxID=162156 RepID=UPI002635CE5F|nr:hypothetical protein [uncultured Bacteroides sp.]